MASITIVGTLVGASGDALAVSPDGRTVVGAAAARASLWREGELAGTAAVTTYHGGPIRFDTDRHVLIGAQRVDAADGTASEPLLDLELVTSGLEFERRAGLRFYRLGPVAWTAGGARAITSFSFAPSKGKGDDVENPGPDGQVVLVDPSSRSLVAVLTDLGRVRTFAVAAGDAIVAATTPNVSTWNAAGDAVGGERLAARGALGANDIAIGPGDRFVAVARGSGAIELSPVADSGEVTTTAAVHGNGATAVAFHPTEPLLASGGRDGSVALWRIDGHRLVADGELGTGDRVRALAFDPGGERLFVALRDEIAIAGVS